jgi:hypothetical protein
VYYVDSSHTLLKEDKKNERTIKNDISSFEKERSSICCSDKHLEGIF